MIESGLIVRHKNPKVKGYGITDGRYALQFGDTYVSVTWDDGKRKPYVILMDIRGLIIRVKAKSRPYRSDYVQMDRTRFALANLWTIA